MKLDEIIAHNKANLQRCTEKQALFVRDSIPGLECDSIAYTFVSNHRFDKYVRKANHYELVKQPVPKYVCTVLCWDKDVDEVRCIHQFGFNNRNRLRNKLAMIQKAEEDIICRVISLNKE